MLTATEPNASRSRTILIIEDEAPIRKFIRTSLENEGYFVVEAADAESGHRIASTSPPDLVLLDLGLPKMSGMSLLMQFRQWFTNPIIIVSARDQEDQKVAALDSGADDYVTKPFGVRELLARVRAALRTTNRDVAPESKLVVRDIELDLAAHVAKRDAKELHLTPIEFNLLATLMRNAGRVMTHRQLLNEVWGPGNAQESHYLRVYVAALRKKIETNPAVPSLIITEQGIGYRFFVEEADSGENGANR